MQEGFKSFAVMIKKINRDIKRLKTELMAEFNLKCPHVSSFYYLYTDGPLTAKELCNLCQEDKGALSRSIDYLEKEGFIESVDKKKKYKSPLTLTENGKKIGKRLAEKIDLLFVGASKDLSDSDRKILFESLSKVSLSLEALAKKENDQDKYKGERYEDFDFYRYFVLD